MLTVAFHLGYYHRVVVAVVAVAVVDAAAVDAAVVAVAVVAVAVAAAAAAAVAVAAVVLLLEPVFVILMFAIGEGVDPQDFFLYCRFQGSY